MTQLTLNIDNPEILPLLKRVVEAFDGVTIVKTAPKKGTRNSIDEALEEVRQGHVYGPFNTVDDLFADLMK